MSTRSSSDRASLRRTARVWAATCLVAAAAVSGAPAANAGGRAASNDRGRAASRSALPTAVWSVESAASQLALDATTLQRLGWSAMPRDVSPAKHAAHPLSVVPAGAPWFDARRGAVLGALVGADGFHGFTGGPLVFTGGLVLQGPGATIDLSPLALRPAAKATALELVDAEGTAWLATANAQAVLDRRSGLLRYLNADLQVLPALATRLGDARYAGMAVGVLSLDAQLAVTPVPPGPLPSGPTPPPCGDWSGSIDVSLADIPSVSQGGMATVDGRPVVVVVPSAELTNVGTANVPWYSKFTHLATAPFDQHPYLVWQMARARDGVLEPLGRSDLKHAFLTSNDGCDPGACTDPNILGLGCSDVYNAFSNTYLPALAPREEVTASTGAWAHCGGIPTHFDPDGNCTQDFFGAGEDSFTHGLKAAEAELQSATATYWVEAFYIVQGDVDIFNSMGVRPVLPGKTGDLWVFPNAGAYRHGPAIDAWVNPSAPGPNADNRKLDTGQGHLQLAVRVTNVVGTPGRKRFAYALQNHDFDRRVSSFHVPFDGTLGVVENLAYADGDGVAANDWTATVDATGVTWTAPAGAFTPPAPLDFASLVSFRFDSDRGVAPATATLIPTESGGPTDVQIQTLAPSASLAGGDHFYTLTPCRLLDTRSAPGAAPIASGVVRLLDAVAAGCGVPASATGLALNVTAVAASVAGEVGVYAAGQAPARGAVSFPAGSVRANNAVAALSADGKLAVRPQLVSAGSVHVVIDVTGYFGPQ